MSSILYMPVRRQTTLETWTPVASDTISRMRRADASRHCAQRIVNTPQQNTRFWVASPPGQTVLVSDLQICQSGGRIDCATSRRSGDHNWVRARLAATLPRIEAFRHRCGYPSARVHSRHTACEQFVVSGVDVPDVSSNGKIDRACL